MQAKNFKKQQQQNQMTQEQIEEEAKKKKQQEDLNYRVLSMEEFVSTIDISPVEQRALNTVFDRLINAKKYYQQESQSKVEHEKQNVQKQGLQNSANQSIKSTMNSQMGGRNSKKGQRGGTQSEMESKSKYKSNKNYLQEKHFTQYDLKLALNELEYYPSNEQIREMIWDIDESNTGYITKDQFELMYKRCRHDQTGLEPRNLYNVVQYMMYLYHSSANGNVHLDLDSKQNDKQNRITVENTLEILYVIFGRFEMEHTIETNIYGITDIIFKTNNDNGPNQQNKEVSLAEYLQTMRKQDQENRQKRKQERQKAFEDPTEYK